MSSWVDLGGASMVLSEGQEYPAMATLSRASYGSASGVAGDGERELIVVDDEEGGRESMQPSETT